MSNTTSTKQIKQDAEALRKQEKYFEAVVLFSSLWHDHRAECSEWDCWRYAYCLRKLRRFQESLDVCQEVYMQNPDFSPIRNLYGWCLYNLKIARESSESEIDEAQFLKAADEILQLTKPEKFSPYAKTVLKVVDYYESRASYPAELILEWTDKIKPEDLPDKPFIRIDESGKSIEYSSDREKWYADRSKALFEAKHYEDCISICQEALRQFSTLHHDNDIWFKRRIALSMGALGEKELAIAELQSLLPRKKDWFTQYNIADFLYELGRFDEAFSYALDAALNVGDIEYKWELFVLMGRLLKSLLRIEEARKHLLLAFKLRQDREWKVLPELANEMIDLDVDPTLPETSDKLYRELKQQWILLKKKDQPLIHGIVSNIIAEGKAGFVKGDNGSDYYFKTRSFQGHHSQLQVGRRVKFIVEKNPDPTKRDIAVFIENEG